MTTAVSGGTLLKQFLADLQSLPFSHLNEMENHVPTRTC